MNLKLHQIDVKTVFLNRELDEQIYIEQPVHFIAQSQKHKVCRLLKSIYVQETVMFLKSSIKRATLSV